MNADRRIYAHIVLFLAVVLLAACKKNSSEKTAYPVNFYAEGVEVQTATRMYTKTGEIKDPKKIKQLTQSVSYFFAEENQPGKGALILTFQSKDSVLFVSNDFKFKVQQTGEQFFFTSSLSHIQPPPAFDHIRYHLLKHENVVTSPGAITSREVRIGYGNYQQLRFPLFAYRISSSPDGTPRSLFRFDGLVNNEFNESSLTMLGAHDTIAVKTYTLTLKAR